VRRAVSEHVKTFRDGREVCLNTPPGRAEYKRRVQVMLERQGGLCGLMVTDDCIARHGSMRGQQPTFEHCEGRGMGGSHRDDRIMKDGKPYNLAACFLCNQYKGSRRVKSWALPHAGKSA
jgi:hypothetical protein